METSSWVEGSCQGESGMVVEGDFLSLFVCVCLEVIEAFSCAALS